MKNKCRGSHSNLTLTSRSASGEKTRFRGVGVILRNLSRDLGLGIAIMTIVRSFSESHLARILVSF